MLPDAVLDPNLALLCVVIGLLLVSWEIHAPGLVLPGAAGVLLMLAGGYRLVLAAPTWYGTLLLILALSTLLFELKTHTHVGLGAGGALLLGLGLFLLLRPPERVSPALTIGLPVALGGITVALGVLGLRAQGAKPATGTEAMIGEAGVARSAIDPRGVVFIHGEYWQARSRQSIESGRQVRVREIDELILEVEAM